MPNGYILDTNIASFVIKKKQPELRERLLSEPFGNVFISAITEAELLRGLAKKPEAIKLKLLVDNFLQMVNILAWNSAAAKSYAQLLTVSVTEGKSLYSMDMLIAAHAKAEDLVLVTNDQAFFKLSHLISLEYWTLESV